ncbi:MAG: phosphotransferase [bacterium]
MTKRNAENQFQLNKSSLEFFLEAYNITDFSYSLIEEGIENTSIKVYFNEQAYVLRIWPKNKKDDEAILLELKFIEELLEFDKSIPIPKIFLNFQKEKLTKVKIDGYYWQAILMDFVDGAHPIDFSDHIIEELAEIQAKMHFFGARFANQNSFKNAEYKQVRIKLTFFDPAFNIDNIQDETIKAFISRAERYILKFNSKLPCAFVHGDIKANNLIVENNKIKAILDFDGASYLYIVMCLSATMLALNNMDKMHTYLSNYKQYRSLSSEELEILPKVILFHYYCKIGMAIVFNTMSPEILAKELDLEAKLVSLKF